MNDIASNLDPIYKNFLLELKNNIRSSQLKAAYAVNHELVHLYWSIGQKIVLKQIEVKWGESFFEALSRDLQNSFPETQGFSARNLKYMRSFALFYPDFLIRQQAVAELPWGHIILLIQKIKDNDLRQWYASQCNDLTTQTPMAP